MERSEEEWPSLSDAATKKRADGQDGAKPKTSNSNSKSNNRNSNNSNNHKDAANSDLPNEVKPVNNPGRSKKGSKKWKVMPIDPPRYIKRGNGRQNHVRGAESNVGNRFSNGYGYSNGIRNSQGNRGGFRGKHKNHRQHQRQINFPTEAGILINGLSVFNTNVVITPFVKGEIIAQMEYWFSDKNLVTDSYLRRRMDGEGFVPLWLFITFPRIYKYTTDINVLSDALKDSDKLEVADNCVRRIHEPLKWILNNLDYNYFNYPYFPGVQNSFPQALNGDYHISPPNGTCSTVAPENGSELLNVEQLTNQIENLDLKGACANLNGACSDFNGAPPDFGFVGNINSVDSDFNSISTNLAMNGASANFDFSDASANYDFNGVHENFDLSDAHANLNFNGTHPDLNFNGTSAHLNFNSTCPLNVPSDEDLSYSPSSNDGASAGTSSPPELAVEVTELYYEQGNFQSSSSPENTYSYDAVTQNNVILFERKSQSDNTGTYSIPKLSDISQNAPVSPELSLTR